VWPFVEGALAAVGTASFVVGLVLHNDDTTNAVLLWPPLCLVAGLGLVSYAVLVTEIALADRIPPTDSAMRAQAADAHRLPVLPGAGSWSVHKRTVVRPESASLRPELARTWWAPGATPRRRRG
jgi:hypothetical protein